MSSRDDIHTRLDALEIDAEGSARMAIPPDWAQGRSTFGGLQAEILLAVMARRVEIDERPRRAHSLQIGFVAPVSGEILVETEVLRRGRSATFVHARMRAGDEVRATALACFAAGRESKLDLPAPPRPALRGPEGLVSMPYIEGLAPAFTRYYELRWATGGPPGSNLDDGSFTGWIRRREGAPVTPGVIAALIDAWPPAPLQSLNIPGPASSLTWALEFVGWDDSARSDDWWACAVETEHASGGWAQTRARLWSPNGVLVAVSQQTVALFV